MVTIEKADFGVGFLPICPRLYLFKNFLLSLCPGSGNPLASVTVKRREKQKSLGKEIFEHNSEANFPIEVFNKWQGVEFSSPPLFLGSVL